MSSSSSGDARVADLLAESFDLMRREHPAGHDRLCRRLAGRSAEIHVDGEALAVRFEADGARVEEPGAPCDARFDTGRRAVLDVIDARTTLEAAVLDGSLRAVGSLDRLLALHDGLLDYVHGAVRCPSFPELLDRFRAAAAARPGGGRNAC